MPKVVVYISVTIDRELREAGLDPAEIVRDSARRGIAHALEAARGTPIPAVGESPRPARSVSPDLRLRRRPTPALDAVGVPTTATTGKIGTPVVPAADVEDALSDGGRQ